MSYLIPTEDLSLAEQARMRKGAVDQGKARGMATWKMNEKDLTARDADYVTDFLTPAGVAVAGLAGWLSMPFAAVGTMYSVFASNVPGAVAPACPTNQIWVFYKVGVLTVAGPDPAAMLEFRTGAAANLRALFDLEALYGKVSPDGYFSQPVTYESPEILTANVECRVAIAVGCRIRLGCVIIEPLQNTVI
jgi:hypothetical protein